jgi:hypothetical protein
VEAGVKSYSSHDVWTPSNALLYTFTLATTIGKTPPMLFFSTPTPSEEFPVDVHSAPPLISAEKFKEI